MFPNVNDLMKCERLDLPEREPVPEPSVLLRDRFEHLSMRNITII